MPKVKVAHLVKLIAPAGKENGILKIVSRMDTSQFEIDIVVLSGIIFEEILNLEKFNIVSLNPVRGNNLKLVPQLVKVFKEKKYDIIYTHSWNTLMEGYLSGVISGIPIKIHGEHGTFERSLMKDRMQKYVWKQFDVIIVVADALRKIMHEEFGYTENNIEVRHNGIDTTKFFPSSRYRREIREQLKLNDEFVIGTVGRFFPVKDHFTLFRAFERIKSFEPKAKLILVGAEPKGNNLKAEYIQYLTERHLINDVFILPPTSDVEKVFNAMDVFVLSSISEGCSNVILEAMACGIPVVATRTGGNPELLDDNKNGLLFPVGADDQLAEKVHRLYTDPELHKKLSHAGPKIIKKHFTIDRVVHYYEELFLRLYEEKNRQ